jgi:hypothetical protein
LGARGTKVGPLTLLETKKLVNFFAFACGAMMTPEQQMFDGYPFPPVPQNPFVMAPHQQIQQIPQQGYYRPPFKVVSFTDFRDNEIIILNIFFCVRTVYRSYSRKYPVFRRWYLIICHHSLIFL